MTLHSYFSLFYFAFWAAEDMYFLLFFFRVANTLPCALCLYFLQPEVTYWLGRSLFQSWFNSDSLWGTFSDYFLFPRPSQFVPSACVVTSTCHPCVCPVFTSLGTQRRPHKCPGLNKRLSVYQVIIQLVVICRDAYQNNVGDTPEGFKCVLDETGIQLDYTERSEWTERVLCRELSTAACVSTVSMSCFDFRHSTRETWLIWNIRNSSNVWRAEKFCGVQKF